MLVTESWSQSADFGHSGLIDFTENRVLGADSNFVELQTMIPFSQKISYNIF